MESYISGEKNARKQNSLNTCIKSLNNMIDLHEFDSTEQNYTEITYNGKISNITSATINYPRDAGFNIPVIAYICGYSVVVGTTDGEELSISDSAFEDLNTTTTETETTTETVTEEGEDSTTTTTKSKSFSNGLVKTTTIVTKITYEEDESEDDEEETTYTKTTEVTTTNEIDYSDCDVIILERF